MFAHDYIKKSIDYIKANISNSDLTINKLSSDVIYLRADYLGKIFKQNTGYSIPTFIRNLRIDMAKNLLRQDEFKIYEISKMVGFEGDSHYFSTVFKKTTGYSPSDYRKAHGMGNSNMPNEEFI
jgi:two-component system response regulator YesN